MEIKSGHCNDSVSVSHLIFWKSVDQDELIPKLIAKVNYMK